MTIEQKELTSQVTPEAVREFLGQPSKNKPSFFGSLRGRLFSPKKTELEELLITETIRRLVDAYVKKGGDAELEERIRQRLQTHSFSFSHKQQVKSIFRGLTEFDEDLKQIGITPLSLDEYLQQIKKHLLEYNIAEKLIGSDRRVLERRVIPGDPVDSQIHSIHKIADAFQRLQLLPTEEFTKARKRTLQEIFATAPIFNNKLEELGIEAINQYRQPGLSP